MATVNSVNKLLKQEFGDLEIVRAKDYFYFAGSVCANWRETGVYGCSLKNSTAKEIVREAKKRSNTAFTGLAPAVAPESD